MCVKNFIQNNLFFDIKDDFIIFVIKDNKNIIEYENIKNIIINSKKQIIFNYNNKEIDIKLNSNVVIFLDKIPNYFFVLLDQDNKVKFVFAISRI